jgi:hypothetical protein
MLWQNQNPIVKWRREAPPLNYRYGALDRTYSLFFKGLPTNFWVLGKELRNGDRTFFI